MIHSNKTMCQQQHKLAVRFANTNGDILRDPNDQTTVTLDGFDIKLGSCVYTESGLVIVDRTPADETTRLWVRDIISLIKYTRRTGLYRHHNAAIEEDVVECECKTAGEEVIVYLPRMSGNMIEEAEHQRLFYSVSENVELVAV